jgi:hypothetical protein
VTDTMKDLVERLRVLAEDHHEMLGDIHEPLTEAADRIEELEKRVLETCEHGHDFVYLADHPVADGRKRCPHCLAIGKDRQRDHIESLTASEARWKAMAIELANPLKDLIERDGDRVDDELVALEEQSSPLIYEAMYALGSYLELWEDEGG